MATGKAPALATLGKKMKTGEPEHLVKLVKRCPHPLCGSTGTTWSGYYIDKCLLPHYFCNSCKREFAFRRRILIVSKKLVSTAAEETALREIDEEANAKVSTAMRRMLEEAEAKELMAEETVSRTMLEEAKAKALTVVRRMREEAAAEAFKEEQAISRKILQELNAKKGIVLRRMREETALTEDQRAMNRIREEADAKASTVMRRMQEEACEEVLKFTVKPGDLTSQHKAAKELSSKAGGTGGGSAGIHFEPLAGNQRESAIEEQTHEPTLNFYEFL